jgi:hypothetical protein
MINMTNVLIHSMGVTALQDTFFNFYNLDKAFSHMHIFHIHKDSRTIKKVAN